MNLLFAWRYFKSKKTTNAINIIAWVSVVAIAIVTTAIIIVLSVFNGFEGLVKSLYTDFYADIKVTSSNKNAKTITLNESQLKNLTNIKGVISYSCVVEENCFLLNEDHQTIATVKGVDENYSKVNKINQYIKRGNFKLGNVENPSLVVGAGIENAIAVDVERGITPISFYVPNTKRTTSITSLESLNSSNIQPVGTFLVQQEFDNKYVFTNLAFMKYMLDIEANDYSSIEIKIDNKINPEQVKLEIQKLLNKDFKVETRYEQNASLFKIMQVEKWFIYALLSLILFIAAFNIVGALTMLVLEKQKDIQILKAMGCDAKKIQNIFLCNGILLASVGGLSGILLATLICFIQQKFHLIPLEGGTFIVDYYPVAMQAKDFALTVATIAAIAFLASYFPSKKAAKQMMNLKS